MALYQHDESFRQRGSLSIAGIDEAGRGPLAGPVVAAAVILPRNVRIERLRDSKQVPEKERKVLFWDILSGASDIGVGIVDHDIIDSQNVLNATKLAMQKALEDLSVIPDLLIVDAVSLPSVSIKQIALVKADSKSAAVAAASIIAKYTRDCIMLSYHRVYPQYNFRKNKGYGTSEHLSMIHKYGPCPIHRKSFRGVIDVSLPLTGR